MRLIKWSVMDMRYIIFLCNITKHLGVFSVFSACPFLLLFCSGNTDTLPQVS